MSYSFTSMATYTIQGHSSNIRQFLLLYLLQSLPAACDAPTCVHVWGCAKQVVIQADFDSAMHC